MHFHLVYTIAKDEKQGALILLITNIWMVLCTGLIVPAVYLPNVAQVIGGVSPLYGWNLMGQALLYGEFSMILLIQPLVWIAIELALGVYLSCKKV